MNNPMNIIKSYMEKNTNPIMTNLFQLAQKGDTKAVETFVRNLYKEHGRDFDKEFATFMSNFK